MYGNKKYQQRWISPNANGGPHSQFLHVCRLSQSSYITLRVYAALGRCRQNKVAIFLGISPDFADTWTTKNFAHDNGGTSEVWGARTLINSSRNSYSWFPPENTIWLKWVCKYSQDEKTNDRLAKVCLFWKWIFSVSTKTASQHMLNGKNIQNR